MPITTAGMGPRVGQSSGIKRRAPELHIQNQRQRYTQYNMKIRKQLRTQTGAVLAGVPSDLFKTFRTGETGKPFA